MKNNKEINSVVELDEITYKEITYEDVEAYLGNCSLEIKPGQKKVSYPIIKRIHRRLQDGHTFSNIKIANNVIDDGHHRFVSLSLLGMDINSVPAGENLTEEEKIEWSDVRLIKTDYDTKEERDGYVERYDK